ncbi:kappa-casein-like isoform X1 [Peromyscus californicus insignis]|uniref:kappa-casein-like isoform X1 n=1 Tax=Peromyscus californicus insignis TaxID=564181 RepID=UPI0022A802DF|nr:kappa-casein-like isoform X1 [Peromyscus californicus insignis]
MMRNFIVVVNILALTLPFLAAEVQNPHPTCHDKPEIRYDQKRVQHTPVGYVLNSNLRYEPNYYHQRPSVAVIPYAYHPFVTILPLLRSLAQFSQWQPIPNFPQPTGVPHPIPSPSFLAIPNNENEESTVVPKVQTTAPVETTPVPITEPVMTTTAANPEASTVLINTPEAVTVPVSSHAA